MTPQPLYDIAPIRLELVESGEPGKVIARGEFGRCDVATANKRRYGRPIIESNIQRLSESLDRRRLFGELDHPNDGKTLLQRVSHVITGLKVNADGRVIGEAEILDTPQGKALQAILKAGCEVGVSSRGMGSVVLGKDGNEDVQDDYILKTYDFVADPATRTAYPKFVQEALEEAEAALGEQLTFAGIPADMKAALLEEAAGEARASMSEEIEKAKAAALEEARLTAKAEADAAIDCAKREFAEQLVAGIADLKEEAHKAAKTEILSDSTLGSSRAMLEAIVTVIRPLLVPAEDAERTKEQADTVVAMRDALQDKDLQIATLKMEMAELADKSVRTEIRHELTTQLTAHPKADQVRKILGPLDRIESVEELKERLTAIFESVGTVENLQATSNAKPLADLQSKLDSALAESDRLRAEIESGKIALTGANEKLEDKTARLIRAVELGARLDASAYAAQKVLGRPDALKILKLAEGATSRADVDRLLDKTQVPALNEDEEVARVRSRVRRGFERELDEEIAPARKTGDDAVSEWLGMKPGEMERLAGVGTPT